MNTPSELADKIRHELSQCQFKELITRFKTAQLERDSIKEESKALIANATNISAQLEIEIQNLQTRLAEEKEVTAEITAQQISRRERDSAVLRTLEAQNSELHDQLCDSRVKRMEKLSRLNAEMALLSSLKSRGGLTEEQMQHKSALHLVSSIPSTILDSEFGIDENWERIGQLIEDLETPYIPLAQQFPEILEFLA